MPCYTRMGWRGEEMLWCALLPHAKNNPSSQTGSSAIMVADPMKKQKKCEVGRSTHPLRRVGGGPGTDVGPPSRRSHSEHTPPEKPNRVAHSHDAEQTRRVFTCTQQLQTLNRAHSSYRTNIYLRLSHLSCPVAYFPPPSRPIIKIQIPPRLGVDPIQEAHLS